MPIPDATQPTLTITNVQPDDTGGYIVQATAGGRTFSAQAVLTVRLGATPYPANQILSLGAAATIEADVIGTPRFSSPQGLAVSPKGNVFVADHGLRQITSAGAVTTLVHDDTFRPYSEFNWIACDSAENLYFVDHDFLVKRSPAGALQVLAGNSLTGAASGRAHFTRLDASGAIVRAPDGTICFVAGRVVRKLGLDGKVSTLAGSTEAGNRTNGTGSAARFESLAGLVVAGGYVYVVDQGLDGHGHLIRRISSSGVVTTLAGSSSSNRTPVDGAGSKARFAYPMAIAADAQGNLFVTDDTTIRKITPAGVVSTFAGKAGTPDYVDATGTAARFGALSGLALTGGTLYVADAGNHRIRKITAAGVVTTLAGTSSDSGLVDGFQSVKYQWNLNGKPVAGATKPTLALAKLSGTNIGIYTLTLTAGGQSVTSSPATVDIAPAFTAAPAYLPAVQGSKLTLQASITAAPGRKLTYQWFRNDAAIAGATSATLVLDSAQPKDEAAYSLRVSDGKNTTTSERVNVALALSFPAQPAGGQYADGSSVLLSAQPRSTLGPLFGYPRPFAADASNNLYVIDVYACIVRRIAPDGTVSTLAGRPNHPWVEGEPRDGTGSGAEFNYITAGTGDAAGNLYVGDGFTLRKITPTGVVTTIAGQPRVAAYVDGVGGAARFQALNALGVDAQGSIYVADINNRAAIRKVTPAGRVSTYASNFTDMITALAVSTDGVVFAFGSDHVLYQVNRLGQVTVLAGRSGTDAIIDGAGTAAAFRQIVAAAMDSDGNIQALDARGAIRTITRDGTVTTRRADDSRLGENYYNPWPAIVADQSGGLFIGSTVENVVYRLSESGDLSLWSGSEGSYGFRDGTPLRQQWYHDGKSIEGATGNTLQISDLQAESAGDYTLVISSGAFSLESAVATIQRVPSAPRELTFDTGTRIVAPGAGTSLTVAALGTEPFTYQWLKDGVPIPGATTGTLAVADASAADRGYYSVRIDNAAGSTTSPVLALDVTPVASTAPSLNARNLHAPAGGSFSLALAGPTSLPQPVQYQWMKDGIALPDATSPTLAFSNVSPADSGLYTLRLNSAGGVITSTACQVTIPAPTIPVITSQPVAQSAVLGQGATFSVSAAGEGLKTYQWYRDGVPVPGAVEAALFIPVIGVADAGSYAVAISTAAGSVTSAAATLTVLPRAPNLQPPSIGWLPFPLLDGERWSEPIAFTVADPDTPLTALTLKAVPASAAFTSAGIVFGGSGANRTIRLRPEPFYSGWTSIDLVVSDGVHSTKATMSVYIEAVDHAPVIGPIANQTILAGKSTTISVAYSDPDLSYRPPWLNVSLSSSNPRLFPSEGLTLGAPYNATEPGTLKLVPAANQTGVAKITITVASSGKSASRTFTVTVVKTNHAPTISAIGARTIAEDASITIPFTIGDAESAVSTLAVTAKSSDGQLLPTAGLILGGSGANRTLTLKPAADRNGTATVTLTVSDGALTATRSFTFTVTATNDAPTLSTVSNQTLDEDKASAALSFTVADAETAASALQVTAASSNATLFPATGLVLGGSGANRTLRLVPAPDQSGTAVITLTVSDGTVRTSRTFTVTVNAVDDAPTLDALADQVLDENSSIGPIPFAVSDRDSPLDEVTVTASSSNPTLLPVSGLVVGGSGAERTLTLTPAAGMSGTANVTITAASNSASSSRTFLVAVNPLNAPPTITPPGSQVIDEGSAGAPLLFTIADVDTPFSTLTVSATSSNLPLVPAESITLGGTGATRFVQIVPAAGQTGTSTITLTVSDGQLTAASSFDVVVRPAPQVSLAAAQRQQVPPGDSFNFAVTATGRGRLSYQWYHDGRMIDGATFTSFGRLAASATDAGSYFVDVTDSDQTHRAGPFFLLVAPPQSTVIGWGDNSFRSLNLPADLLSPIAIAAGWTHSLALERDGTIRGWSIDHLGNLNVPDSVTAPVAVAAGAWFSLALNGDGTGALWGDLAHADTFPFTAVNLLAIAAGEHHALGLKLDRTVTGWGENSHGEISVPGGLSRVCAIAAGASHSLALVADGRVIAWGDNRSGQLNVPATLANVTAIAAGGDFSLALKSDGTVVAWGDDSLGQTDVPAGLTGVSAISAGEDHALALKSDGSIVAWGGNWGGQTTVPASATRIFALSAGAGISFALRDVTPAAAPVLTTQPVNASVAAGQEADFSVIATGYPAPTYRWQISTDGGSTWRDLSNDATYAGTSTSVLTIAAASVSLDGARFRCLASNASGADVASAAATLTVTPAD